MKGKRVDKKSSVSSWRITPPSLLSGLFLSRSLRGMIVVWTVLPSSTPDTPLG